MMVPRQFIGGVSSPSIPQIFMSNYQLDVMPKYCPRCGAEFLFGDLTVVGSISYWQMFCTDCLAFIMMQYRICRYIDNDIELEETDRWRL